jgi:hypothetical protein
MKLRFPIKGEDFYSNENLTYRLFCYYIGELGKAIDGGEESFKIHLNNPKRVKFFCNELEKSGWTYQLEKSEHSNNMSIVVQLKDK